MKIFSLIIFLLGSIAFGQPSTTEYYNAFLSNDRTKMKAMDAELKKLQQSPKTRALRGALQAKISLSEKDKSDQMRVFMMGKEMLEKQCRDDKDNVEYRFLRLCVQTFCNNSKYNENVQEDKKAIIAGFSSLDSDLKNIVKTYAETSPVFKDVILK